MLRLLGIAVFVAMLSSCSSLPFSHSDDQQARCKEMKRRIIFNGAKSTQELSSQPSAEMDNLNRTYKAENCS